MALKLSKSAQRSAFAKLRTYFADSKEHDEIAALLGFGWSEYEELLAAFYDAEAKVIREQSTERVYVDYCITQGQNIRDLTKVMATFDKTKQPSAIVAAIRARSDIYDKMIKTGQEFGFIEKKPETKLVAGVIVQQLSDRELRSAIVSELGHLEHLMGKFGNAPNIIDLDPGDVHQSTPKTKVVGSLPSKTTAAHKRNKVHGGRRVVKQ